MKMPRTLDYSILDVFAERPLEGNPLAVFHDARSLSDAEMQALARETNLAETTFILPEDPQKERAEGVRVRIFATQEELPFAGHPTLGTASWLHLHHPTLRGAESITLRLNVGPIPVRFEAGAPAEGVRGTMRQNDPIFGAKHDRADIARALGLQTDDLSPDHAPQTVSTGMPFCIVLLRDIGVSQRLQIPQREAQAWLAGSGAKFFYCIAPLNENGPEAPQWHARMQFYSGEDPATGSAAGCCIAWLVQQNLVTPDTPALLEQGVEIHRNSRITAQASRSKTGVHSVLVSGRTMHVASGRFFLP
jgi:trans-2,3-dihydro-3-hydroxyanthranilate isomerase